MYPLKLAGASLCVHRESEMESSTSCGKFHHLGPVSIRGIGMQGEGGERPNMPRVCSFSSSVVPLHWVLTPAQRCSGSFQLPTCQKFPLDFPSGTWMWLEKRSNTRSGVFTQGMSCALLLCPRIFRKEMCRCEVVKITCFLSGNFIPQLCFGSALTSRAILGCSPSIAAFFFSVATSKNCVFSNIY